MINKATAVDLKNFIWGRLPREILEKCPIEVMSEINKMIDKATLEPRTDSNDDHDLDYLDEFKDG